MTIKMRLDTESLRALIRDNPALEIEIEKAVLNNITDDVLKNKVTTRIDAVLNTLATQTGHWPAKYELKSESLKQVINDVVTSYAIDRLEVIIDKLIGERVSTAIVHERTAMTRDLKAVLREVLTPEMARDIVREKIL